MIRKHRNKPDAFKTPGMTKSESAPAAKQATDPIDVIAQHWADISGLSRTAALHQLALIGHMTMKQNTAGINELRRELDTLIEKNAKPT